MSFTDYLDTARYDFVVAVNKQNWNTELRLNAENLLIAYDQMLVKIKLLSDSNVLGNALKREQEEFTEMLNQYIPSIKLKKKYERFMNLLDTAIKNID